MFFSLVNKENFNRIAFSIMLKYKPEEVLYYFLNSYIEISLKDYLQIKKMEEDMEELPEAILDWLNLFDNEIDACGDLLFLEGNDYLERIGPYYFNPHNIRFYFSKKSIAENEDLQANDLSTLYEIQHRPVINVELQKYYKLQKSNNYINKKNKDNILNDISYCIASLDTIEAINKHINYLNKMLNSRYEILEQDELFPSEPDLLPEKPNKIDTPEEKNLKLFGLSFPRKKNIDNKHNHETKVYLIRYREYEKACDRYKLALENWAKDKESFLRKCKHDIRKLEAKHKSAQKVLEICNSILTSSLIHPDYQDMESLKLFKNYLETGRADDTQDCMNLFEEEKLWLEIKASQERIENTIHFIQNANEEEYVAELKINELLLRVQKKDKLLLEA